MLNYVGSSPTSESTLTAIKTWLDNCVGQHTCQDHAITSPNRLLYVGLTRHPKLHLIESTTENESVQYIALSYCWGERQQFVSTKANYQEMLSSIDERELSQTLRDAVFLTRCLGIQYLWIDSLCIVQDDRDDWARQSAKMGMYYSNAHVTISASNSGDSQLGFLHQRETSTVVTCGNVTLHQGSQGHQTDVLVSEVDLEDLAARALRSEPLTRRGWTVQERLLSKRILHFTNDQVIWECSATVEFENGDTQVPASHPINQIAAVPSSTLEQRHLTFRAWSDLIQQYSSCRLTHSSDRLPALAGLANTVQSKIRGLGAYIAGHWEGHLPHTLIWDRRLESHDDWDYERTRCPSWSWSSVDDGVYFIYSNRREPDPIARILSFDIRVDESNRFGEVSYGTLDMTAPMIKAVSVGPGRKPIDPRIWLFLDDGPHLFDAKAVFDKRNIPPVFYVLILVAWRFDTNADKEHGGLLVAPTGSTKGEYRRIGAFGGSRNTTRLALPSQSQVRLV